MCWDGRAVQLVEVKGFYDLAAMLAAPGRALHCLALAGRPAPSGEADDVLDARARREVEERIRELQQELDVAEAHHDLARGAHARAELDALVESLSKALGIRQRSRKLGSATEKARSAVTWRIRSAIRKIADAHAGLGRHLENAVRTGTYCVYEPETRVDWEL